MARHIALLRAINVGGKNKLPMSALVEHFEAAGCREVSTYIQSGNVLFSATTAIARRAPAAVSAALRERHGLVVPVITRTAAELVATIAANPYLRAGAPLGELHVMFLAAAPTVTAIGRLDPHRSPPDEFVVRGAEIYVRFPSGVGRTKLSNAYFDKMLSTTSTMRNWHTVLALAERATAG